MKQKISAFPRAYLLYMGLFILVVLAAIEGLGHAYIHFKYGSPGKSYGLWQTDPELGATHRPYGYNTLTSLNNYGFRNREDVFEPKPKNALRVIAFGGSTTFGYNLRDGETFTEKLESKLRALPGYEKTQVLNAGEISYSAKRNLILIKRLIPKLKPDYVILYEGLNEPSNAWMLQKEGHPLEHLPYGSIPKHLDSIPRLKQQSIIVRFFDYQIKSMVVNYRKHQVGEKFVEDYARNPWVIENFKVLFREMIDYLKAQGIPPIVIRYAARGIGTPFSTFSDISLEIAEEKSAVVCDMRSRFEMFGEGTKNLFIESGIHVTPQGADILADELYQTLMKELAANDSVKSS